jgi:peptide-methionine (R)-S-oxide reductase
MLARRTFLTAGALGLAGYALLRHAPTKAGEAFRIALADADWRKKLTPAQYRVLRQEGTETPFSSPLDHEEHNGVYACAGCDSNLFSSETKYDSGTGWPSFYAPMPQAVRESSDFSMIMKRTAVSCDACGGHLGHVFDDGPKPTGLRYCMNGVAMTFKPASA